MVTSQGSTSAVKCTVGKGVSQRSPQTK